jgi:flagellar basal-body rod modification protein FlgD
MHMVTSSVVSGQTGTQLTGATSATSTSNPYNLQPADFIKMMITQLQNQDPMEPAKNEEILQQMSDIGQLETSTQLQTTLKSVTLQTQIGSASALIGKSVQGLDDNNDPIDGVVNSVKVDGDSVDLQLDTGMSMALSKVSSIGPAPVKS